jgi:hypothetical protein
MFTVKEKEVFYGERLALTRDLIIDEEELKEISFDEDDHSYNQLMVIDNMLVYVLKYKEEACENLQHKWHFAFQSLNEGKMVYLYESFNLYLGH